MLENKYVLLGAAAAGGLIVGGLATGYVARRSARKAMEEVDASFEKLEKMAKEAVIAKVDTEEKLVRAEEREEALRASLDKVISKTGEFTDKLREDFKDNEEASEILATRVDELASELDALADEWE